MTPNQRGAAFMVMAMAAFAVEDALFKSATQTLAVGQALMIFGACGAALFALMARSRGESPLPVGGLTRGLAIRSVFELAGRLFWGLALAFANLGDTAAILQATPLVVVAGAVVVFGERVGWRRWTAIAVGFAGVLLVLRPTGAALQPAALFALIGMLGFAGRDLATRAAKPTVTNAQLGVLGFSVIIVAGIIVHLITQAPLTAPPVAAATRLIGAALVGTLAYASLTTAMRTGEVGVVTPFRYTRLVFALILGGVFFGEQPDSLMLAGSALIVGSGIFTLLRSRK